MFLEFRNSWPALLSVAGTLIVMCYGFVVLGFFAFYMVFTGQWLNPSDALPYASIGVSGLLGLVFSLGLLFDDEHRRIWGIIVLVSSGVAAYFLVGFFLIDLQNSVGPLPARLYILVIAPMLGLAGAIWGVLQKPDPTPSCREMAKF